MIDLTSTVLKISVKLSNKPKHKYGLFTKLSLAVFRINPNTLTQSFPYYIRRYSLANPFLLSCYFESEHIARIFFSSPHDWCLTSYVLINYAELLLFSVSCACVHACVRTCTYINLVPLNSLLYYASSNTRFVSVNQFNMSIV